MKLQHLRLAFCDEIKSSSPSPPSSSSSSLTVNFNCLWPTAAKKPESGDDCTEEVATSLELKSNFNSPKAANKIEVQNQEASPPGSTRWNPTHEQIRMLEELYKAGMRTPNAQQIERITAEIGKHGKIEGKNVFYWFQNHKARERQRKKRTAALLALDAAVPSDPVPILSLFSAVGGTKVENEMKWSDDGKSKRKCRSWGDVGLLELDDKKHQQSDGTLELFPLRPESLRNNQTTPAPTLKNLKDIN